MIDDQKMDTPSDQLAHYGVKGMKWGKHRESRLQRHQRIASGNGSLRDKAHVLAVDTSAAAIKKNGGLAGASAARAAQLESRKKRIQAGKGTVKDLIALHGGDRLVNAGGGAKGK